MNRLARDLLRERAHELGIDLIRFTHVGSLQDFAGQLRTRLTKGLVTEGFCRDDHHLRRRSEPASHLREARTAVCAALGYFRNEPEDSTKAGEPHGRIARYTWCDYYGELRQRLRDLGRWLKSELPGVRSVAHSNYISLAEKPLSVRAGVGWQGKNSLVLDAYRGSWTVLGELVTQAEFEPDQPQPDGCGTCDACMKACPTGALVSPGVLDTRLCIQYWCGAEGHVPAATRSAWQNRLYGCSACQDVCPYNRDAPITRIRATRGCVGASVPLLTLFSMTDDEIRRRFSGNQMAKSWVKPEYLVRNAALCLGNLRDPVAVSILIGALSHPSPPVRGASAWALGQLGGKRATNALAARRRIELDGPVLDEIQAALR